MGISLVGHLVSRRPIERSRELSRASMGDLEVVAGRDAMAVCWPAGPEDG
jgi:hypothetical protein